MQIMIMFALHIKLCTKPIQMSKFLLLCKYMVINISDHRAKLRNKNYPPCQTLLLINIRSDGSLEGVSCDA